MILLVFYTAFHCLVLSAVSCAASVGYIFVNSLASTPVFPNSLTELCY